MSDELIVNDADGAKPRVGGYEFGRDASGLWLSPFARQDDGWITVSLDTSTMFGHHVYYGKTVSWGPVKAAKPDTASAMWDNPETVTGEIIAYRAWDYDFQVTEDGKIEVRLESLHQDFYWDGPVTSADEPPTATNPNGLYAIRGDEHHKGNFTEYMRDKAIWGRIGLSGVVVEGDYGYRAERATIQELWVNPKIDREDSPEGLCKLLADRYQCDATPKAPKWRHIKERAK